MVDVVSAGVGRHGAVLGLAKKRSRNEDGKDALCLGMWAIVDCS